MFKKPIRSLVAGLAVTAALSGSALADSPKDIAIKGVEALFGSFDKAGIERYFAEDYIQHNPAVPTGRAPIIGILDGLKKSGISVDSHRVLAEGDLVVFHNTYSNAQAFGSEKIVAFDLFRIEDGKIAEHWDNITPVAPANPSGHSQTDGPSEIVDLDKTAANKALCGRFRRDHSRQGRHVGADKLL